MKPRALGRPAAILLALGLTLAPLAAQEKRSDRKRAESRSGAATGEAPVMSAGRIEQTAPGEYLLTGDVDFKYGNARLLADTARYSEGSRTASALGNVVLQFDRSQVSGDSLEMNLDTGYASVENARAYVEPDVILDAERLERIGEDTYRITNGKITTCTQPTPYWSFSVSRAVVRLGGYARMTNASFKLGRVPAFWSPYLVWPVKEDRAAGLLIPQFGFSGKRGGFLSNAVYVPLGRSMDATLQLDIFNGAVDEGIEQLRQIGQGLELRFVPSRTGSGVLTAYHLKERFREEVGGDVESRTRYRLNLAHTQTWSNGFRLVTDINNVSDLDYYQDFEREFSATSNPTVLSQTDLSRVTGPLALNVRFSRQWQFLSVSETTGETEDKTLWRLPEIELRGRGIRLGSGPFYLSFESSLNGIGQRRRTIEPNPRFPNDPNRAGLVEDEFKYARFDLFPTVSGNFVPVPWLDISPSVSIRETFYTASNRDPNGAVDPNGGSLGRELFRAGVNIVGPRFYRLYGEDAPGKTRYKHTFEPSIGYDYIPDPGKDPNNILLFDEVDFTPRARNLLRYSVTSRLFAKRPEKGKEPEGPASAFAGSFASLVTGEEPPTKNELLVPLGEAPPAAGGSAAGEEEASAGDLAEENGEDEAAEKEALEPSLDRAATETYVAPEISTGRGGKGERRDPEDLLVEESRKPGVGAVEVATFDLTQNYTFDETEPLSDSDLLGQESQFSPVQATVRVNPSRGTSLDLRATYDILFDDIDAVSLSGNLRSGSRGYLRGSWVLDRDLEGSLATLVQDPSNPGSTVRVCPDGADPVDGRCFQDRSQVRLLGGMSFLGNKVTADVEGSYDIEQTFLIDQRYRVGYNTQCCAVLVEVSRRNFQTEILGKTSETEYRFVLNLRGVGTFLDLNGRAQ